MVKWKTQTAEPDTCEGAAEGLGCVIYERFDTEADPRIVVVAGYKQRCTGHTAGFRFPQGRIQATGFDEGWRDAEDHLNWERKFYKFATGQGSDPITPAIFPAPTQEAFDNLVTTYAWHRRDNALKGRVLSIARTEDPDADPLWWFEGVGETRVLHVDTGGKLNPQQRKQVGDATELQFGLDRLIWEG